MFESKCMGCGCKDSKACVNQETNLSCFWVYVDELAGVGVCSECGDKMDGLLSQSYLDEADSLTPEEIAELQARQEKALQPGIEVQISEQ